MYKLTHIIYFLWISFLFILILVHNFDMIVKRCGFIYQQHQVMHKLWMVLCISCIFFLILLLISLILAIFSSTIIYFNILLIICIVYLPKLLSINLSTQIFLYCALIFLYFSNVFVLINLLIIQDTWIEYLQNPNDYRRHIYEF